MAHKLSRFVKWPIGQNELAHAGIKLFAQAHY